MWIGISTPQQHLIGSWIWFGFLFWFSFWEILRLLCCHVALKDLVDRMFGCLYATNLIRVWGWGPCHEFTNDIRKDDLFHHVNIITPFWILTRKDKFLVLQLQTRCLSNMSSKFFQWRFLVTSSHLCHYECVKGWYQKYFAKKPIIWATTSIIECITGSL